MNSDNAPSMDEMVKLINQHGEGVKLIIVTRDKLQTEVNYFMIKEKFYGFLAKQFRVSTSYDRIRNRVLCKAIAMKFNIVKARRDIFSKKLDKAADQYTNFNQEFILLLTKCLNYESSTEIEKKELFQKLEEASKLINETMTNFQDFKREWGEIKGELSMVLDDCIEKLKRIIFAFRETSRRQEGSL